MELLSKKTKKMIKKLSLSKQDFDHIKQAVAEQEKYTTGEIALALTAESDSYSFWELFFAVICGVFVFAVLLPLTPYINSLLETVFWHVLPWYLPAFCGLLSFLFIALFFALANIPAIDRFIVPYVIRHKAVYNRALRHFIESGVYSTNENSGILIFISVMEREVRIIADSGIGAKIDQLRWDTIASELSKAFKENYAAEGVLYAVEQCGKILADNFPAKKENPNELVDGLVVLEAGE